MTARPDQAEMAEPAAVRPFSAGREMARGGIWMILMRWAMRTVGLVSTLILARLLDPADFGVIAMAMIIVGLLEILTHLGVDLALIRIDAPQREDYDSGWTLQLMISAGLAVVIFASAPLAVAIFDEPKLGPVVQALSVRSLIQGFANIGTIDFRRNFNFAREFKYNLYNKMAGFIIVVTAAVILRSYWALVIGMTLGVLAHVAISYLMHPYRPRLCFRRIRPLLGYSTWIVANRLVYFATMRVDQFVVGNLAGTRAMGNYYMGFELATLPTIELVLPMARGVYPVYARLKDSSEELFASYLKTLSAVALLCIPISFGLASIADRMVPVVLGENWMSVIPYIQSLSVFGTFYALYTTTLPLMQATAHMRLATIASGLQIPVLGVALYLAATRIGVDAVALTRAAVGLLFLPVAFWQVARVTRLGGWRVTRAVTGSLWHRFAAGLIMAGGLALMPDLPLPAALSLLVEILAGGLLYTAAVIALWYSRGRPVEVESAVLGWVVARLRGGRGGERTDNA